jgi:hypothetical protein
MDLNPNTPSKGQYPYRFTQDDRFQYRVKVQPVAGQLEFSVRPVDTRLSAMAAQREFQQYPKRTGPSPDTDRLDNVRRSQFRAKAKVKLLCMELRVDRLFTYTIRLTGEPIEYSKILKIWDYYRRMALRYDKTFAYVATPEKQKNGQYHIHAGVHGFMNVDIHRRMWQSALNRVLGRAQSLVKGKDSPGTVNCGHRPLRGQDASKSKRVACYISKYIGKAIAAEFNRKSYFHTIGIVVTPAQAQWLESEDRDSALSEVLRAWGLLDTDGIPICKIWCRDSCSAWFTVPVSSIPPPF